MTAKLQPGAVWLPHPRPYQRPILISPARFKLLICGRRWGKTKLGVLAAAGGHGPLTKGQRHHRGALHGARIGWIVPSEDHPAAAEVWSDLKTALRPSATLLSEARKVIALPGGGSIRLWSGFDPDHLRGPYFDGVVVDECSLQHERVWHALRPTLSDYGGWGLLLGTVPEDVGTHWFVRLHRYALSPAGRSRAWDTWRRPSWDNRQLTKPDLDEAKETLGTRTYLREYGAELLGHAGGVWQEDWFRHYDTPPAPEEVQRVELYLDAAWRTGVRNDFSCCQAWARTRTGYYLLGELRGKWESPELRQRVAAYRAEWLRAYPGMTLPLIVEAAGGGLVAAQELRAALDFPVIDHEVKGASKVARAELVTPLAEGGKVFLPAESSPLGGPWIRAWLEEVVAFPALPHDDRVDAAVMALQRLSRTTTAAHAYTADERGEWGSVGM